MRWLLDTNVVSETIRRQPSKAVIRWISQLEPDDAALSLVTMAELAVGVATAPDADFRERLSRWLNTSVIARLGDKTLPLTQEILVDWLSISRRLALKRIARAAPDLLIASTARVHHLTVVSRNVRDFADTGIVVYDPWHDQTHRMNTP